MFGERASSYWSCIPNLGVLVLASDFGGLDTDSYCVAYAQQDEHIKGMPMFCRLSLE